MIDFINRSLAQKLQCSCVLKVTKSINIFKFNNRVEYLFIKDNKFSRKHFPLAKALNPPIF